MKLECVVTTPDNYAPGEVWHLFFQHHRPTRRPIMHVLTIFDHPQRKNFPGAVLDTFVEGIVQAGHTGEVARNL